MTLDQLITRLQTQATNSQPNQVIVGLMAPMLMMVLNITMFSVALPAIRDTFVIGADVTAWLVTAYMLPYVVMMPLYGRLGDGLGKRRLFMIGLAIFIVGSLITMLAANLTLLIIGRVIQGIGSAGINPLSIAIIADLFPPERRGKAMGTWNSMGPVAGMTGPVVGGFLVEYVGWASIFGPIVLIALVAIVVAWVRLPPLPGQHTSYFLQTLDWVGVALLASASIMLMFYLSSRPITGVAPLQDWRLLLVTIVLFAGFYTWEQHKTNPFIDWHIFANGNFSRASFCAATRMFVMSSTTTFLLPLYLTDIHNISAVMVGFVIMLHAASLLVLMRFGGTIADRWSSRPPIVLGAMAQVLGLIWLALLPGTASPLWVVTAVVCHSLGAGTSLAALHRSSMQGFAPEQSGGAAGLYSMIRFAGTAIGVALTGVALQFGLDAGLPTLHAYQLVFMGIAGVAALGVIAGWGVTG